MNHRKIGIIGGAGPSAGSLLFNKVIEVSQRKYGLKKDVEFPHMLLLNYPFSDMLSHQRSDKVIKKELNEALNFFVRNDIYIISIACNTLHAFLPKLHPQIHLVHMIAETRKAIINQLQQSPIVLSSTTSSEKKLHQKYFPCDYVTPDFQETLDIMIAEITRGGDLAAISMQLSGLLPKRPIILGCTEFSYLHQIFPLKAEKIYDPNEIVGERMAELYFSHDTVNKKVNLKKQKSFT